MDRRHFIRKAGLAAAGAFAAPYLLPGGRLFASSGLRKVNHVVFLLFAGGVRNLESVQFNDGNLMPNMLSGGGTISPDILPAIDFLPPGPLSQPLQNYGTLFRQFRYKEGPTGHYNGHTVAVTGQYVSTDLNIREAPCNPTVFEYYRKHNSPQQTALNSWWVANTLGPYPALNYSSDPGYGPAYGANFISPNFLISQDGFDTLGDPSSFSTAEAAAIRNIRKFANGVFNKSYTDSGQGIVNTESEAQQLQQFISDLYGKAQSGQYINPWGVGTSMNSDMYNVMFAEEIIQQFKPELLVVNMQDVDIGHFDFSQYANNLRKADWAAAHLWSIIQSTPGMANDTVLVIAPEHGRNFSPNTSVDAYGRLALDHTAPTDGTSGDQMAREIFCLIVGPPTVVKQGFVVNSVEGESTEIVPVIANMLGFDNNIPGSAGLKSYNQCDLAQAFY
ncbi:MAG: hypothetical protein IPP46_02610 [Bacteroidetes bacterium]|nr:hypothetical protein [Bacteroidota bacterium]